MDENYKRHQDSICNNISVFSDLESVCLKLYSPSHLCEKPVPESPRTVRMDVCRPADATK